MLHAGAAGRRHFKPVGSEPWSETEENDFSLVGWGEL